MLDQWKTFFQFRFAVDASAPNLMERPLIFVNLTTVTMTFMHIFWEYDTVQSIKHVLTVCVYAYKTAVFIS